MEIQEIKSILDFAAFCKRAGIVFQNSEIYGGFAGFYDFGPRGVEIKNKIKQSWWQRFVHEREDMAGIDGTIVTHPRVWEASGHLAGFNDILADCPKCKTRVQADHLIEDVLGREGELLSLEKVKELFSTYKKQLVCPKCKSELSEPRLYNTMFKTFVGPIQDDKNAAFMRPETAQVIFTNFKTVADSSRLKLPFGIAQIGKSFRNEIAPRDFLFRVREFEQMEVEYFVHPKKVDECPDFKKFEKVKLNVWTSDAQKKKQPHKQMTFKELVDNKQANKWLAYWLAQGYTWFVDNGVKPENLRIREHHKEELAHYAMACFDLEYNFPFGWKELFGAADRGQFDLKQHSSFSKQDLSIYDEETKEKVLPHVAAEPSFGVERAFLVYLMDAYTVEKDRIVLKLNPRLAPIQVGIFPLMKKDKMPEKGREIYESLKKEFICEYDESGSIGKRYRRMDEIGTPFSITIDYDSVEKDIVTVRHRDTMKQDKVKVSELRDFLRKSFV